MVSGPEDQASFTVSRRGLKWVVEYCPPGQITMTTELSFWRRKSAESLVAVMSAAFYDGHALGRKEADHG